jgi:lipopolysaccharide export LptBFGC system permease protein LptF
LVFNHKVSPYLNHHSYQIYYKLLKGEPFASLEENAFNKIGNRQIFIEKIDKKKGLLKNVYIFEDAGKFGLNERMFQVIQAKSAVLKKLTEGLFEMKLKQGMIHQFSQTNKSIYNILSFDSYTVTLNLGEGTYKKSKLEELTSLELKERISKMMGARSVIIRLKLELASRTSLPFACCIFVLLAISTALWTKRSSRSISFGLSSLFILTYYLLFMGGQFLSHKEIVSPSLGVWIPNILLGIWGIISLNKRLKA